MSKALLNRICLVLAFAGMFVAGFLSLAYWLNVSIPCGGSSGCDTVAAHPSSHFLGLPVAYYGFAAYLSIGVLGLLRLNKPSVSLFSSAAFGITLLGTIISFVLIFISLFVIHATCLWCLASAGIMTLSFVFHSMLAASNKPQASATNFDMALVAVLIVATFGILSVRYTGLAKEKNQDLPTPLYAKERKIEDFVPPDAAFLGDADAPVVVVEFGDLLCPHCRNSYYAMKTMVAEKKNKIKFVFRHFALVGTPGHEYSGLAAVVGEYAAEKGQFWPYLDAVFALEADKVSENALFAIVAKLGLDPADVYQRTHNPNDQTFARFYRDREEADKLGLQTTPSFLIGLKGDTPELEGLNTYKVALQAEKYQKVLK